MSRPADELTLGQASACVTGAVEYLEVAGSERSGRRAGVAVKIRPDDAADIEARALCLALSYALDDNDVNKGLLRKIALETNRREIQVLGDLRRKKEAARAGA